MFENEQWREIRDFPHYHVSNYGRVKHVDRVEARKISINDRGFPIIVLYGADGKTRYLRQINQLVADAFLSPATFNDETSVWHVDGDVTNCRAENLKWETRSRVLEWNEMHRTGRSQYNSGPVRNTRTGKEYADVYECAMDEGRTEGDIFHRADRGNPRYEWI